MSRDPSKPAPTAALRNFGGAAIGLRRVIAPIGFALLLSLSFLFFFQTWEAFRFESVSASAEMVTTQARQTLGGFVSERQSKLAAALMHPEVERYFATVENPDPVRALAAIRERMPEVQDARFVGANVLDAIGDDMAGFGYANAEMLLSAARLGAPAPAQVHGSIGKRELVMVNPVTVNASIVGFVLAKLAYEPLRQTFADLPKGGLGLALVQGEGRGTNAVLEGSPDAGLQSSAVPGTMLRVAYRSPEPFIVLGPGGSIANLVLAVACLLGGALVAIWRRRPDLLERLLHRRTVVGKDEPTVAERALTESGDGPVPASSKARAASRSNEVRESRAQPPPPPPVAPQPQPRAVAIDRSIFRAYDIRGVIGKTLSPAVAQLIGQAIGSEVRAKRQQTVVVGRDGRISGPELSDGLIKGLLAAGCDVIDIGAVPTPVLYYAIVELNAGSGVMVTGSHNPPDYNGFKIVVDGSTLAEQEIQDLYARIVEDRLERGRGALTQMDMAESYIERISGDIQLESPLRVVLDAGNGIAGGIAPRLFEAIGCEVVPLYCEVDGTFPHHHPDPSDPRNLEDLLVSVKRMKADIGLAFDGDGDRLGVVTRDGKIVYPDRLLMLFARDVLSRNPGASIIYDVKCTNHLSGVILGHGGSPIMWKTGHSLIKKKMKETHSELAGEMSGHFFFKERWYGFDDGLYAGCRLLEIIAAEGRDPDEIFDELPQGVSTHELKIQMEEGEHYRFMEKFRERSKFDGARLTTIDGVRADWSDGWGLVRCSNTTPCLVLRFDADDGDALARIQSVFRAQLLAQDPKLTLPF
jgi:phosphomannomutase/phosphoglucomutase